MPALSLYHGLVLTLESSPHSSTIKLKLHPSCRPGETAGEDEDFDANDYNEDIEADETRQLPRYFGEDLDTSDREGPTDVKEIKLDDIVDCRKLLLT